MSTPCIKIFCVLISSVCRFKGPLSLSGFSHDFSITSWIRIAQSAEQPLRFLIFELQRPKSLDFNFAMQQTLLRLYLNQSRLELVDFNWKTCYSCVRDSFRIVQSRLDVSVSDGLWHHIAVSISTDLHKIPSSNDHPDLLYLFGTE